MQVKDLALRDDLFDDFCVLPQPSLDELPTRLEHLFWRAGGGLRPDLIEHGPLLLNLETYQAAVAGRVLDLTYMEYELLRFLSSNPGSGLHPRDAALAGVGLRVLRRRPDGRRPHQALRGQARRRARPLDPGPSAQSVTASGRCWAGCPALGAEAPLGAADNRCRADPPGARATSLPSSAKFSSGGLQTALS